MKSCLVLCDVCLKFSLCAFKSMFSHLVYIVKTGAGSNDRVLFMALLSMPFRVNHFILYKFALNFCVVC